MKLTTLFTVIALSLTLSFNADAKGSFGGSRGGGSSFGGSRSGSGGSSFGGGRGSNFGGATRSVTPPSGKSSSFGGSRSSTTPAPVVRNQTPPSSGSSGTVVNHNYYGGGYYGGYGGYGGYYGGGSGFWHGMMFGYLWNRPNTVYVGGQQVYVDTNGQPMYGANGQVIVYESHPFLSFLGTLLMLTILGTLCYYTYVFFFKRSY